MRELELLKASASTLEYSNLPFSIFTATSNSHISDNKADWLFIFMRQHHLIVRREHSNVGSEGALPHLQRDPSTAQRHPSHLTHSFHSITITHLSNMPGLFFVLKKKEKALFFPPPSSTHCAPFRSHATISFHFSINSLEVTYHRAAHCGCWVYQWKDRNFSYLKAHLTNVII